MPALLVAQAIGRVGNYFNQELFGRPTTLPWAVEIDPEHRPDRYLADPTFHPTFLYEIVWNLVLAHLLGVRWNLLLASAGAAIASPGSPTPSTMCDDPADLGPAARATLDWAPKRVPVPKST